MNRHHGPRASRSRLSVYLAYALLPFALVGILEGVLRLTGVGARMPLFVAAHAPGYMQSNDAVVRRLFFRPQEAPDVRIDTAYFLEARPKDGIRIVVQGASAAAGFPFGRAASLTTLLQQRLERDYPGRQVEVISTAMPMVNSFALLNFADEIAAIEPDAVVIYAGHNEFLGILGVGSAFASGFSPQVTRLLLSLRKLNLVEAGFQVYGAGAAAADEPADSMMAQMVGQRRIPYGSELFAAGHRQFRENLTLLLDTYRARDIPVFIGTLASNEKGLPPFTPTDLEMSVASAWNDAQKAFAAAVRAGNAEDAAMQAGLLVKLAPDNAMSWYLQGQAELLKDRPAEARHAYLRAKDLDQLRFRAPESFNDIIRSAALEHSAMLVDVQQALAVTSPDRIIGDAVMLDHLHPDAEGYFRMADAFHGAIIASGILGPPASEVDQATALSEIPVNGIERLYGQWRMERELHDWPFVPRDQSYTPPEPTTAIQRIARAWYDGRYSWAEAMDRALAYYRQEGNARETGRIAAGLAMAIPFEPDNAFLAGSNLLAAGDPDWALPYLQQAVRLRPDDTASLMSLAEAYYASDRAGDALAVLDRVLEIETGHPSATALAEKIRQGAGGG